MAKTQTSCPNCRQPVVAEVEQLFDMNVDPQAKQKLLSGLYNTVQCPTCGYEGNLSTPIVYHDPEKELLLTHFPADLGLPVNEQERLIGPLINKVVNNLPQEKRKGYLFKPQTMFTMQTMIEKILEGDGITKEMLDAQQNRVKLIEKLVMAPADAQLIIMKEEDEKIDQDFFVLLARLIEASAGQGDKEGAEKLGELQQTLFEQTTTGKELAESSRETNEAIAVIRDASKDGLTREKLLDILKNAGSETKLRVMVSLVRTGLDYEFYEILTKAVDSAEEPEKSQLVELRTELLELTSEIDKAVQIEMDRANKVLDAIINAPDLNQALNQNAQMIDEFFVENLNNQLTLARNNGDLERIEKLNKLAAILQQLSAPPPEVAFIEELLKSKDETEVNEVLEKNSDKITPEFLQVFNSIVMQYDQQENIPQELKDKLRTSYETTLKYSMKKQLTK